MKLFIKALVISGSIAMLANLAVANAAEGLTGEGTKSCPLNQVNPSTVKKVDGAAAEESEIAGDSKAKSANSRVRKVPTKPAITPDN